jgi:hypothetical protein
LSDPPKRRLKNEELDDLAAQLTLKQQQQEQEEYISPMTCRKFWLGLTGT